MDCVSVRGDVMIGYVANLIWRKFSLNYSSLLLKLADQQPKSRTSMRECDPPKIDGSQSIWNSVELDCRGYWTFAAAPIQRTLLESDAGSIEWHCICPKSEARICIGAETEFTGTGYVEHVEMSIPPWKLPFRELRWGRFLSDADSVVWVAWTGAYRVQCFRRSRPHGRLISILNARISPAVRSPTKD